jgi:manganese/zinc/iron transport system permease protein
VNELIPPFELQRVLMDPWTTDVSLKVWVVLMGFLVTSACGWVGQFLILRRLALMGDAISHSILPGLVGAFLVAAAWSSGTVGEPDVRDSWGMYVGALIAALLTTLLIEWLHRRSRLKQDAAMGTVFSAFFALGVLLITLFADHVDLDADCVLYGEIGFVPFHRFAEIGGVELAPLPVMRMGVVALLTVLGIALFYKELVVSSFDPGLATSLGIRAGFVHGVLMAWLSIVIVSAFESVGAILVVAMLIFPGATGSLLFQRLPWLLAWVPIHAALSAVAGLHLALWLDCSLAGAMVVSGGGLFLMAWMIHAFRRRTARLPELLSPGEAPVPDLPPPLPPSPR